MNARLERKWSILLDGSAMPPRELVGGKAWSIAKIRTLGLRVPPAFVFTTQAHAAFDAGHGFSEAMLEELKANIAWLEGETGKTFGRGPNPLLVSVRSGAAVSMPGMMDTVLNLGVNDETEAALAAECADAEFAADTHRRFLTLFADIVLKAGVDIAPGASPGEIRAVLRDSEVGEPPTDPQEQLEAAVRAVFQSWNSRRARRYREHHNIPHSLGTAVTVQAMVFGNLDDHSGTGVLFSRNPLDGRPEPYGEYLRRAQGEDVVSGKFTPEPLSAMARHAPVAHAELLAASAALESSASEIQDIEFTVERGQLYILQARNAKLAPLASVRTSVDLVNEGVIDQAAALHRLSADHLRLLLAPTLLPSSTAGAQTLATGEGACPGVGIGVVVSSPDEAERLAALGEKVVLARATTCPDDLHGMIAAVAVITEEGGSTSHAAVVCRALGVPCVVGCGKDSLKELATGVVTVDGQAGKVFAGALPVHKTHERDDASLRQILEWAQASTPLKVYAPSEAPAGEIVEVAATGESHEHSSIAAALAKVKGAAGARGVAIGTDEGVRAALDAGLQFIVTEPQLPALISAIHARPPTPSSTYQKVGT